MRASVIIPAAGLGRRMRGFPQDRVPCNQVLRDEVGKRKPFILLGAKPILSYALDVFKRVSAVKEIILVVNKKDLKLAGRFFPGVKIAAGGSRRQDSVYNGLKAAGKDCDIVLFHDGVRPFATKAIIEKAIKAAAA